MEIRGRLEKLAKERKAREKHLWARMWFSTIVSFFYPDRGVVFPNIGTKLFIGNNQYITGNHISNLYYIGELSLKTPVSWTSHLIKAVKAKEPTAIVNVTFKNFDYNPDLGVGLDSRIYSWQKTIESPVAGKIAQERCARLMYSKDVIKSGERTIRCRLYVTVRCKTGSASRRASRALRAFCDSIDAEVHEVKSDLETHLKYVSVISSQFSPKIKDVPFNVFSLRNISELLPNIEGVNDAQGSYLGINIRNMSPYYIDFRRSARAKNIAIFGLSGYGKTALALYWAIDFRSQGFRLIINDIKGNEFTPFTIANKGLVFSLKSSSTVCLNSFVMNPDDVEDGDYVGYYTDNFEMSREQLLILAAVKDEDASSMDTLIISFLEAMYEDIGVRIDNPNTWRRTFHLNHYVVYDKFIDYLSDDLKRQHSSYIGKVLERYGKYICKTGSHSYTFRDAFKISDLYAYDIITFDYSVLSSSTIQDEALFRLKYFIMKACAKAYTRYNKRNGLWTVSYDEESEVANDEVIKWSAEKFATTRSQNEINVIIGNSIDNLIGRPEAAPIVDNINVLCLGMMNNKCKKTVTTEFNLEKYSKDLDNICNDPSYENVFLLVNRMQRNSATGLIRAVLPDSVTNSKLFKVVDTVED